MNSIIRWDLRRPEACIHLYILWNLYSRRASLRQGCPAGHPPSTTQQGTHSDRV
jgi:hypothetical protein